MHTSWNLHKLLVGVKHRTMCLIKFMPEMASTTTSLLYRNLYGVDIHFIATIDFMRQSHINNLYNVIITSLKQQRLRGLYKITQIIMTILQLRCMWYMRQYSNFWKNKNKKVGWDVGLEILFLMARIFCKTTHRERYTTSYMILQ